MSGQFMPHFNAFDFIAFNGVVLKNWKGSVKTGGEIF
jgi:hypothetical protein